MKTLRFPVAAWEDGDGCVTAKTLDGEAAVAVDTTVSGALSQLKKYLRWRFRQSPWSDWPDMGGLKQHNLKVQVRPQYTTTRSVYPCERSVDLRVPTIVGNREDGSVVSVAPTIGVHLSCVSQRNASELTLEALRRELSGLTPDELSRCLPPERISFHSINVKVAGAKKRTDDTTLDTLRGVADAVGDRSVRKRFGRAWRRDSEIAALARRLGDEPTSLVLVGDTGSGKTTILANAIRQVERRASKSEDAVVESRHRFWLTSGARLIAGMQYLGQWEERCEELIDELDDIAGTLCVENLLELLRNGGCDVASTLAAFFAPYISHGELRLIGEATRSEWDACRRMLPNFASLFQVVSIDSALVLAGARPGPDAVAEAARNHRVEVDSAISKRMYHLVRRFLPGQPFPGKPISMLTNLIEHASGSELAVRDLESHFQEETGLPESLLKDHVPLAHNDVLALLEGSIFGQPAACDAAASVVTRFKAGLNDPGRPLGVMLFCGPTGVGKTELAKSLAKYLFGAASASDAAGGKVSRNTSAEDRLLRLDMSEYSGFAAADRLMTRPDGRASELIERVRSQPFVVILLDEIEKASSDVFDVLLGLLDEGRLTDRFGRTTMFTSAVVIMTSNLGAQRGEPLGFGDAGSNYEREVFGAFRPESFNRIDSVVTFNPLSRDTILEITRKELRDLNQREGIAKANIKLTFSEELVELVASVGFDPSLGARPLQRTIEQLVVSNLARFVVSDQSKSTIVHVALEVGKVVVQAVG